MAGLDFLFAPSSVAVIGASRHAGKVGYSVFRNIISSNFPGKVYPINPSADEILGHKAYKSILDVNDNIDLAIVTVPAELVLRVAEECGQKRVKGMVVISAGFKESGRRGAELERILVEKSRKYNFRILGPNCLGFIDTFTPINASFASGSPLRGNIGFASQSGAILTGVLEWSLEEGIGFSKVISLGNKSDLNEADTIEALASDSHTKVILLYLEGVEDGVRFFEVARKASRMKPIVVLKSGVSSAGARAASSHTGALAGSDKAYSTAFNQIGILRAHNIEELFNYGITFSLQNIPKINAVAIITNAGGPGIIATDKCEEEGLPLARFEPETIEKLRSNLPKEASIYNPVDILGDAQEDRYRFALETVLSDSNVGHVLIILTPQAMTRPQKIAEAIVEVSGRHREKAVVASFIGGESVREASKTLMSNNLPCFDFPERGVKAIAGLVKFAEFMRREPDLEIPVFQVDKNKVNEIFTNVYKDNRVVLLGDEAAAVARAYGIPTPEVKLARSLEEAVEIAESIGYPLVMKVASPHIIHKTDIGGVIMNLENKDEVSEAYYTILSNVLRYFPSSQIYGILVQQMVPQGKEIIIGMTRDLTWGPMVGVGLGGIYVNLFEDVSFKISPFSRKEAFDMLSKTKAYRLLKGMRGEKPSDIDSVIDVILRVSQLSRDFRIINEMDINPLFAYEKGCSALDVKITLEKGK
ncbi:MAG: acetate--CoA ligase family protein [Candidatus Freyarchaeota archaeon]|nr:acetate--CoA ligase family protein [Candidatus Jordarchaeia archaeon]MBS7280641.1 acetate--CoA ligase family protein [Candidatus Jordarchaeia archaeon]